jgi:ATP synthase I subunit
MTMEAKLLRTVERWNLILGATLTLAAAVIFPRLRIVLGVATGAAIASINFTILRRLVEKLMVARSKGLLLAVVLVKMVALLVSVWLVLKYLPVNVIAFTCGLSIFLVSFFVATVKVTVAQAAEDSKRNERESEDSQHMVN